MAGNESDWRWKWRRRSCSAEKSCSLITIPKMIPSSPLLQRKSESKVYSHFSDDWWAYTINTQCWW